MRDEHETLREAIGELRSVDAAEAPSYAAVVARPRRRFQVSLHRAIGLAVGAAMLVAASVDVSLRIQAWRTRLVVPAEVRELSAWRPMTDVLLETPNTGVLTPRVGESLLPITPILEDDQ